MSNYGLPKYDIYREWIRRARTYGEKWGDIVYALKRDEVELAEFLKEQAVYNWWDITVKEWKEIVGLEKIAEEQTKDIDIIGGQAMIMDEGEGNEVTIPMSRQSSWQLYKNRLLSKGFKEYVVNDLEKTTLKILKRLSKDTTEILPVKGLVIGNVQSGKTANMAALMAMAADWGWNMFIVLSGTIENLRQQTHARLCSDLFSDLKHPGNLYWTALEHLSKKSAYGQRAQDLHFEEDPQNRCRYFTVCLKNPARLRKLIQWLQSDINKQKQMKILVIDDESDQAGINTADISNGDRRTINRLICNLVNGKNEKGQELQVKYKAMNYIGYTATPYANVLNEAGEESLYPRSFISTLGVSKEYFGPQQIFGIDGGDYDGMDIVRTIRQQDLDEIKQIHDEASLYIPQSLKNALCWFMCGVACMRLWGHAQPISMLIHTSQKTEHHRNIADAIKNWIRSKESEEICNMCEKVWNEETQKLTFQKFREQYPDYDRKDKEIPQYPNFSDIKEQLLILLKKEISNIPLGEEEELEYHEGIHLCIDNCKNNGLNEDGMYVRLAYPNSKNTPSPAPAFIVVGGATLSRGLTIEGIISTFFLRSVNQADTLMQMGRWFGYRKGYELLPRLWITAKTNDQFKFLSALDQELREEIHYMDTMGLSPAQYGPKVKNTPKYSFIRITAKNRMQSAKPTDMDFSGSFSQTYLFDNDIEKLSNNKRTAEEFITNLGEPEKRKECNQHAENTMIWRNVNFSFIKELLINYQFQDRLMVFNDIYSVISWIENITKEGKLENWNVVVAGKINGTNKWKLPYGDITKVNRTRKADYKEEKIINIGALRDPRDIIADVDLDGQSEELIDSVRNFKSKVAKEIRSLAGLDTVPQLIIYIIDKDSKVERSSESRKDLDAVEDIVGICMNIPGGKRGTDYTSTVSIHLKHSVFNDEGDLEEKNEN